MTKFEDDATHLSGSSATVSSSSTKILTRLLAVPSNRTCADCRSPLVDASQVYASFSPEIACEVAHPISLKHFQLNHHALAPEGVLEDAPTDPAVTVSEHCKHGVFVCASCAEAHTRLGSSTTIVIAVHQASSWKPEQVQWFAKIGSNTAANSMLEAHLTKRPINYSSSAVERLQFCRLKYQALSYCLPIPSGPLAEAAWGRILELHPEWMNLWGADLLEIKLDLPQFETKTEIPNSLCDYFCVVTPHAIHPSVKDLSNVQSPEQVILAPCVSEHFPLSGNFPEPSAFCFPDGCRPSCTALPPTFFNFVLTNGSRERLYGGCLTIHDDGRDTHSALTQIMDKSEIPLKNRPLWLQAPAEGSVSDQPDVIFYPKCLVVLSHYGFHDLWRNALLHLYRIALTEAPLPMERFVANFVCEVPLPPPGKVRVQFGFTVKEQWTIERPAENQMPLANFSFQPLFSCLSVTNVLIVMGLLMEETRVVLLSKHFSLLTPVAEALVSFLFPMHWQGIYIPVLPYEIAKDVVEAPVPFLVGLHSKYIREVPPSRRPSDVVFVDLDRDEVHLGFINTDRTEERTIPVLPDRQASKLKGKLEGYAALCYLETSTLKIGTVTTGSGREIAHGEREPYAQVSDSMGPEKPLRRRDVFPNCDKAFSENELLVPISGFISDSGQFHGASASTPASPEIKSKRPKFTFNRKTRSSGSGDFDSDHGTPRGSSTKNLLDLSEPQGFASSEIRHAFLGFFVSLFRHYRDFFVEGDFNRSEFVSNISAPDRSKEFLSKMVATQMFDCFIRDHQESPDDAEVKFFDESITAKRNRSKKVALVPGRKRETTFLNDNRSMVCAPLLLSPFSPSFKIREIFTPPPPSTVGLPADGRSYQYGTFPKLNPSLFGQTREPMRWKENEQQVPRSLRRSSLVNENEQILVERVTQAMAPRRRRGRSLETALKTLSSQFFPFNPVVSPRTVQHSPKRRSGLERRDSDLTMPSAFEFTPDIVTSAEEVVMNARRKQSILLEIIVKFQAHCRCFIMRRRIRRFNVPDANPAAINLAASLAIQRWFWSRMIKLMIRRARIRVQALFRGFLLRKKVRRLMSGRLKQSQSHLFVLWQLAQTPLAYRTLFWSLLNKTTFVRLKIVENELRRLWNLLKLRVPDCEVSDESSVDVRLASRLGPRSGIHWESIQKSVRDLARGSNPTRQRLDAVDRIEAERAQVYERLLPGASSVSPGVFTKSLSQFAIQTDKKKKAAIAKRLWVNMNEADHSRELMTALFPELAIGTDISFRQVSKKTVRRFPSSTYFPPPLGRDAIAFDLVATQISQNVAEVAGCLLRRIRNGELISKRETSALMNENESRTNYAVRVDLMRDLVGFGPYVSTVPPIREQPGIDATAVPKALGDVETAVCTEDVSTEMGQDKPVNVQGRRTSSRYFWARKSSRG